MKKWKKWVEKESEQLGFYQILKLKMAPFLHLVDVMYDELLMCVSLCIRLVAMEKVWPTWHSRLITLSKPISLSQNEEVLKRKI